MELGQATGRSAGRDVDMVMYIMSNERDEAYLIGLHCSLRHPYNHPISLL